MDFMQCTNTCVLESWEKQAGKALYMQKQCLHIFSNAYFRLLQNMNFEKVGHRDQREKVLRIQDHVARSKIFKDNLFSAVFLKNCHVFVLYPLCKNNLRIRFQLAGARRLSLLKSHCTFHLLKQGSFCLSRQVVRTQISQFWSNWPNFGRSAAIFRVFCGR